ncbi:hypothetical protein GCM10022290_04560 [Sagittula marina]
MVEQDHIGRTTCQKGPRARKAIHLKQLKVGAIAPEAAPQHTPVKGIVVHDQASAWPLPLQPSHASLIPDIYAPTIFKLGGKREDDPNAWRRKYLAF